MKGGSKWPAFFTRSHCQYAGRFSETPGTFWLVGSQAAGFTPCVFRRRYWFRDTLLMQAPELSEVLGLNRVHQI